MSEHYRFLASLLLALSALSCASGPEQYHLRGDEVERRERRHSRLNVTLTDDNSGSEVVMTPSQFVAVLDAECTSAASSLSGTTCDIPQAGDPSLNNSCRAAVCLSSASLCVANRYLELGAAIEPIQIGGYTVPPQSNATKADFFERALYHTSAALNISGEALRTVYVTEGYLSGKLPNPFCGKADVALTSGDGSRSLGDILVGNVAEATALVREGALEAVRANVAHADAEPTRTTDYRSATRAGWHDPFLSRGRAAQLLFGEVEPTSALEEPLPYGLPETCALPRTTTRGARALEYLRSSGLSPAAVRQSQDIESFLDGQDGVITRLHSLLDLPDLGAGDPVETFLEQHELSADDFIEARAYLRCELDAFPRDETEYDTRSGVNVFHATSVAPRVGRGAALWAEVVAEDARYDVATNGVLDWDSHEPTRGAAYALDYSRRLAADIVSVEVANAAGLISEESRNFMGSVAASTALSTGRSVATCVYDAGASTMGVRVVVDDDGDTPVADYFVLTGVSTLECAVHGTIDGADCELTAGSFRNTNATSASGVDGSGHARRVTLTYDVASVASGIRDFVVRRETGLSGYPRGGFELVAPAIGAPASSLTFLGAGEELCGRVPAETGFERSLDGVLDLDPSDAGRSRLPCTEMRPLPVPLESELTDDGDAYESSWRSQLATARAAAEYADALGEEHIARGLDIDSRAEIAQREIQSLCGVTVDLANLFDSSFNDIVSGDCSGGCPSGYQCMRNACVRDLAGRIASLADERSTRILSECLGVSETVYPAVALGTEELCVWQRDADPSVLCHPDGVAEASGRSHPCPFRSAGSCTNADLHADWTISAGYSVVPVEHNLEFFSGTSGTDGSPPGVPTPPPNYDCATDLRTLRNPLASQSDRDNAVQQLVANGTFSRERVMNAAERLGWKGDLGDFSSLTIDGTPLYGTGNPRLPVGARVSTTWPCSSFPGVSCASGEESLFCQLGACGLADGRAPANQRLARAVVSLGILSGYGLGNTEIPFAVNQQARTDHPDHVARSAEIVPLYVRDASDPLLFLEIDSASWNDNDGSNFSGRQYLLRDPTLVDTVGVRVWTGDVPFTSPHIAGNPFNGQCSGEVCDLHLARVLPAEGFTDEQRRYTVFMFANLGDWIFNPNYSATRLESEISRQWYGVLPIHDPARAGAVRRVMEDARLRSVSSEPAITSPIYRDDFSGGAGSVTGETVGWMYFGRHIGNYADVLADGITSEAVLDALELTCFANSEVVAERQCSETAPTVTSPADLPAARMYLRCLAAQMEQAAERVVIQNVPRLVVDAANGRGAGIAPLEGEFGRAVSGARETLLALREQPRAIAAQLRAFESELQRLEIELRNNSISAEIIDWEQAGQVVNTTSVCAAATVGFVGGDFSGSISCGAAVANLAISFRVNDLRRETVELANLQAVIDIQERLAERADAMHSISAEISRLVQQLDGHLASISAAQIQGRNALSGVLFSSSVPGREYLDEDPFMSPVNAAMRRRYSTSRARYDDALWRARRATVLARRSLEQHLGMSLADVAARDLPLYQGGAARLEAGACELGGLDYRRIRDAGWPDAETGAGSTPRTSYADGYIGDYVRDLEAVMSSYEYAYPYTDGRDTIVVSLRDDILGIRRDCALPSYSELSSSNQLQGTPAWMVEGCDQDSLDNGLTCVSIRPLDSSDVLMGDILPGPRASYLGYAERSVHAIQGFRVATGAEAGSGGAATTDLRIEQVTSELASGVYRLSWYGRQRTGGHDPSTLLAATTGVDAASSVYVLPATAESLATGWSRYFIYYEVHRESPVTVALQLGAAFGADVDVGGIMLERVDGVPRISDLPLALDEDPTLYYPRGFLATDGDGLVVSPACEDTFGEVFRRSSSGWTLGCDRLCPDGLHGACASGTGGPNPYCYWQQDFVISQEEIERGVRFALAGFAYGNFNYRIERLGVNVVGTRDCEASETPSTCYSAGTVPFSLTHIGPYTVRNYIGADYEAPLYEGSIDFGRALTAERYFTNPVSSADRALVEPFMRDDFNGRPLGGSFRFRLWESPGFDFSRIEDVQFVIEYRYWNRSSDPGE